MRTTAGKLIVNDALPDWLRDYATTLTSDETEKLLGRLARKDPDNYREIAHKLTEIGRNAAFDESATLSLSDMQPNVKRAELFEHARSQTARIQNDPDLTDAQKKQAIGQVYGQIQKAITDENYDTGRAAENPFALQVLAKARGTPGVLAALQASPGSYTDPEGNIIPVFISRSFAEGLRPHEYWAGSFGARTGVVSTKFATRDAGDLGKQFNQASMRTVVTADDCGTLSGIPVKANDRENIGAELAQAAGKYPAGTVVTKEIMNDLGKTGEDDELVVRSPMSCGQAEGVCKHCVGLREDNEYPKLGDHVGITASSALAERIAQGGLNKKHSGGMSSDNKKQDLAGFDIINQLFQVPKQFAHSAAVATIDGEIERIDPAPQGGVNVYIGGQPHHVLPENEASVKVGDKVEAGDQISDGLLNPRDVLDYKGVGEARRYLAERATKAFRDSGYAVHRRNMELLVRGVINHAELEDDSGPYMIGDVVDYNSLAATYKPREDAKTLDINASVGQYLEQPVLHHTIGTKVTDRVVKQLRKHGYNTVTSSPTPPLFRPRGFGLRAVPQQENDWMAQLGSSHLTKNLLKNVHRGADSNLQGLHPVPAMAKAVDLGRFTYEGTEPEKKRTTL